MSASLPSPQLARPRGPKRQAILESATRVFARTGYHEARVSDIAREAGIAYGLVYHYFTNKEEILDCLFEERWTRFVERVDRVVDGPGSARSKLEGIANLVLLGCRRWPDWVKVVVFEIQRSPRFADPARIRAVGRLFAALRRLLRQGQARGELRRDVDPDVAASMFLGALEIAITARVLELVGARERPGSLNRRDVSRTVVEVFLHGMAGTA